MKKILMISAMYPYPRRCGFTVRLADMCEYLSSFFKITLIVSDHPVATENSEVFEEIFFIPEPERKKSVISRIYNRLFPPYFDDVYYMPETFIKNVNNILSGSNYDICMIHTPKFARCLRYLESKKSKVYKVVDTHDIWYKKYLGFKRIGYGNLLLHFRDREREIAFYKECDLVIAISLSDYNYLCENGIASNAVYTPVSFIPDKIYDPQRFDYSLIFPSGRGPNNIDAINFFISEIFPLVVKKVPQVKFKIVNPCDELKKRFVSIPNIIFIPFQEDIRNVYRQADIVVIPLRVRSGLKIKLLESFAFGMPVIFSPEAVEGVILEDYPGKDFSSDPESFASKIIMALKNKEYRNRLSKKGLEIIKKHYSRQKVYSELVERLNASN